MRRRARAIFALALLAGLLVACAAPAEVQLNPTRPGGPPKTTPRLVPASEATATPISLAECLWTADVFAWIDANGNGRRDGDPQEPSLPNVLFHIEELRGGAFAYGGNALSSYRGKASAVLSSECGPTEVEISAHYPPLYQPTTPERVQLHVTSMPIVVRFGFQLKPGVALPAAESAPEIRCSGLRRFLSTAAWWSARKC